MTDITPALLAEFKHRVPDGTRIPDGTEALVQDADTFRIRHLFGTSVRSGRGLTYWTREPIRPPLPTGLGAVLKDVTTTWGTTIPVLVRADMLEDEDYRWFMATIPGSVDDRWLRDENLATWTVVSEGVEL